MDVTPSTSRPAWQPSREEVADIVQELRPLIAELARRDEEALHRAPLRPTPTAY